MNPHDRRPNWDDAENMNPPDAPGPRPDVDEVVRMIKGNLNVFPKTKLTMVPKDWLHVLFEALATERARADEAERRIARKVIAALEADQSEREARWKTGEDAAGFVAIGMALAHIRALLAPEDVN